MARCRERQEATPNAVDLLADHDHLKWKGTRPFTNTITHMGSPDEDIKYSGWVEKINFRGAIQPRVMVITNMALYNFKSRLTIQCKRRVDISLIVHIIRSKYSHQFILCCPQEYDYLYSSVQVGEICDILMAAHKAATGNNMTLEYKVSEDLQEFALTRREAKKIRKDHPELTAPASTAAEPASEAPKTTSSTVAIPTLSPAQQEKITRAYVAGEDSKISATTRLLPDHHIPSAPLEGTAGCIELASSDPGNFIVLNVLDEVYVVKNTQTGAVLGLKEVDSRSQSRQVVSRCTQQLKLCLSLVIFQVVLFCAFCLALRYMVTSCYKR